MCDAKSMGGTEIRARTSRWGSSPVSEPVMYQLGLKPLPQVPPRTAVRKRRGDRGQAHQHVNPKCRPSSSQVHPPWSPCLRYPEGRAIPDSRR